LRRRVLDGPEVSAVAVVVEFQPAAISGQGEAGLGGVTISGSKVRMIAPERFKGLEVFVHHRAVPPANSCWRVTDCNVMFAIKERMLEIRQSKEFADYATFLYDADLRDVKFTTVTVPPSRGSRTDSDKR
jgi:hypothetical protein